MKKNYIKALKVSLFLVISALLFSCQIGLGDAIDMAAPEITVTTPSSNSSTGQTLLIKGNVSDNECLSYFTVNVSKYNGENVSYKYDIASGTWFALKADGTWDAESQENPINASYSGNNKYGNWELSVSLSGSLDGITGDKYTIKSQVFDNYKNDGSKSLDSRVITLDTVVPTVSIISPAIFSDRTELVNKNYLIKNNDHIRYLNNKDVEIEGIQVEDTILGAFHIYIDEEIVPAIDEDNILENCLVHKEIQGERSWSTIIKSSDFKTDLGNNRHYLRLVTQSFDIAGNEKWTMHGWFVYDNNADIPWITADFGDDDASGTSTLYPECAMQGQAFDDDGIKKIIIDLYIDRNGVNVKDNELSKVIDLDSLSNPTYYAWSVNAPGESCTFYVDVKCIDKFGTESDTVKRYLHVKDVTPPNLIYSIDTGKSLVELCDSYGNFSLSGSVTDDGNIPDEGLKIVRIVNESDLVNYFNSTYDGWKKPVNPSGNTWEDSKHNKVWIIPLSGSGHERTFNKAFNIFTDFGIDLASENYLSTQNFVIMATDATGVSTLESFALQGDNSIPEFKITNVQIYDKNDQPKTDYSITDFTSTQTLGVLDAGDKIKFEGTWSDDSSKFTGKQTGKITLTWNEISDESKKVITKNANGSWNSQKITIPSGTSSLSTLLTFTDLGNKSVTQNFAVYFKSSKPEFMQYGSNNSDKSYKAGDKIEITMEFNKKVKFSGSNELPKLELNVNNSTNTLRYATYKSGNETAKHIYEYEVQPGDNVSDLNVKKIIADTNVWKEVVQNGDPVTIAGITTMHINDSSSLASGRDIVIDTTAPFIDKENIISTAGCYKSGKNIYFELTYSEAVEVKDINKLKLKLNISNNSQTVYAGGATKTGDKTYRFKYSVDDGDECAGNVIAEELLLNGATITDLAGNSLVSNAQGKYLISSHGTVSITIDTDSPAEPVIYINESSTGFKTTYYEAPVITIPAFTSGNSGYESSNIKKISKDNGRTYEDYTGAITLSTNGKYEITAYHEDAAGNRVECSSPVTINVDKGDVLESVSANVSDGTYTTGKKILIKLFFRKAVYVDALNLPSLTLNVNRGASESITVPYKSGNGTKVFYFEYEVVDGDNCSTKLEAGNIVGDIYDASVSGTKINAYADVSKLSVGNKLTGSRTIKISTNTPEVSKVSFNDDGTQLKIKFNKDIKKNSGDIVITQTNDSFLAPSVVSKETYDLFPASIKKYYVSGTNGASYDSASGKYVSDIVEKYILTENPSTKNLYLNDNTTLCNEFKTSYSSFMTVTVPVTSGSVTVSGDELIIDITGSYKVPVKGASYNISIPVGLVKDSLGLTNAVLKEENDLFHPGCENPTIRIQKKKETVSENTNPVQPFEVPVVIDCRTPGAKIVYQKIQKSNDTPSSIGLSEQYIEWNTIKHHALQVDPITSTNISKSDQENTTTYPFVVYSSFNIGLTDTTDNNKKGCKILITARSSKVNPTDSSISYDATDKAQEMAYRTVLLYNDKYSHSGTDEYMESASMDSDEDEYGWRWVRGGDNTAGGVSTPGFPVSWNTGEYSKTRAMTYVSRGSTTEWYWISWDITVPCYTQFLIGNMPSECSTKGPESWCWSANGFVAEKDKYPLYPGESLIYNQEDSGNGSLTFFKKHREQRTTSAGISDSTYGTIPYIVEIK